ncbi:hypothetical protein Tco_0298426 [Tanacetum coccineum]
MDYQCTQPSEIEICRQAEEIERQREIKERNRVHEETMQMLREMIKIQEEKRISEEAARREEEKRIAKEKEAAELEAKCKIQECLNIEEKSIPQASTRSKKFRIDPTLSNFTISTKRIPFSEFNVPPVETVNSLRMGDKHLDKQKGSLESSVKDPILIPRESDVISDGDCDDDYQKRFDLKVQQLWMPSIYDENNKIRECYIIRPSAITPDLPIPDSLIMEDEHLDTIPVTESTNTIKSSVEDLVPTPSESADLSDGESECDVPINDDSPESHFSTFDNPLFDSNDDFSSDDESLSEEEIPKEEFKFFSNPLYDIDDEIITNENNLLSKKDLDEIIPIPPGIDERCFNAESDLLESLLNRNSPIDSTKIDFSFDEFSLPRPPEISSSQSFSQIPMEEIDLFLAFDDSMPPGIEDDDYDSEEDIRFLEELLNNDSFPLPENESFSLDHFDDPSLPRPPPEPPDVEICFDFKPDKGVVTNKVVGDISEHDVLMPNLLPTQPTLCPLFDLLLPFSSENEDKVFNPGILISSLLSHRGEIISNFSKSPMMISGGDIPHLDVPFLHFYPP